MYTLGASLLVAPFLLWSYAPDNLNGFVVTLVICGPIAAAFFYLAIAQNAAALILTDRGVRVKTPWYGRFIDYSSIELEHIRTANLDNDNTLRPRWRTNGIGLPGLRMGWFRTRDKRKALLVVTNSKVIVIPTHEGYLVLASVASPQALADAIRKKAAKQAH